QGRALQGVRLARQAARTAQGIAGTGLEDVERHATIGDAQRQHLHPIPDQRGGGLAEAAVAAGEGGDVDKAAAAARARAGEDDSLVARLAVQITEGHRLAPQHDVQAGGAARRQLRPHPGAVPQPDRGLGDAAEGAVADLVEGRASDGGAGHQRQGERHGREAACELAYFRPSLRTRTSRWGNGSDMPAACSAAYTPAASSVWILGQRSNWAVHARSSKSIELSSNLMKTAWGTGSFRIAGCARATDSRTSTTFSGALP